MKKQNVVLFLTSITMGVAAGGCNTRVDTEAAQLSQQNVAQVREHQAMSALLNKSGCMDLPTVVQKYNQAKQRRDTLADMKFDGTPSDALLASFAEGPSTDVDQAAGATQDKDTVEQDGCNSVTEASADGLTVTTGKIISSSPTQLKLQETQTVKTSSGSSENTYLKTYELLSSHQIRVTLTIPVSMEQQCEGKSVSENHQETLVDILDFGSTLPNAPVPAAEVQTYQSQISAAAAETAQALETQFCSTQSK